MATKTTNLGLSKAELTDAVRSTLIANNENFDKIDEAYTQLKQENEEESQAIAENAEQIDTLQGQIDRLRANQIQGSASGTEVVIQDAAEMESVLRVSGNSEQETSDVMPSPDYPSEIRSVKSKSDNLFPPINTQTTNGVTCIQNSDGSLTLNGTATASTEFYILKTLAESEITIGEQYTLSTNDVVSGIRFFLHSSNEENWVATQILLQEGEKSKTGVISNQTATHYKFVVRVASGTVLNNIVIKPMLNKGDKALPYQPYGYVPVEVKVEGKNKLKLATGTHTINGVTVTVAEDGLITLNGTIQGNYPTVKLTNGLESLIALDYVNNSGWLKEAIGLVGKFTLKRFEVGGTVSNSSTPFVCLYNQNGERLTFMNRVTQIINSDTSSPLACAVLYLGEKDCVYSNYQFYLMLEEGTTQTTKYEPYKAKTIPLPLGDIELRSTPDGTRDTFARVDGVWKKVGKIMPFTITEDMVKNANITDYEVPFATLIKSDLGVEAKYPTNIAYFTSYKEITSVTEVENGKFATNFSNTSILLFNENITDLATAKTILAGETGIIKLATPTYTSITDEALISALDELEQLILHKGYNYITATSANGVKAQLDLSYIKDINAVLDNLTAAILTLGGELNV